jgi:LemA protein
MKRHFTGGIILAVMIAVTSSCGYNVMQANEEAVMKAWGDIESQLQRRSDLVPNLV